MVIKVTGCGVRDSGTLKKMLAEWLAEGVLEERLPEVEALRGVMQPPEYHPEGDVYAHTMMAIEMVADDDDPRVFWGVLLHDIGKAYTTLFVKGRWRAHGHAEAGAKLVQAIMERFGCPDLSEDVAWLVRHHDFALSWNLRQGDSLSTRQKRFVRHPLFPLLRRVCAADSAGALRPDRSADFWKLIDREATSDQS